MKRKRALAVFLAALGGLFLCARQTGAATPPPAADLTDTFTGNPLQSALWSFTGAWAWSTAPRSVISPSNAAATALYHPGLYYAGTLAVRLKLLALPRTGRAVASIIFAADPATGASRWVRITSGAPGSVEFGQTGTIGSSGTRVIKRVVATIPLNTWLDLSLTVRAGGKVSVKLGTTLLFMTNATPLAAGKVGFSTTRSRVAFDSITFTNFPDDEPCKNCHAGQVTAAPAPDVYRYWDGTWWDTIMGGAPSAQQGGHGDGGGAAASACTGDAGCHDLRLPMPGFHRNGRLEPRDQVTANSYHLRSGFINAAPTQAWDVELTFDSYCSLACHKAAGVPEMEHCEARKGGRPYLELGLGGTGAGGTAIPGSFPLDHDLTSAAPPGPPLFAPCVTCHDPHGTASVATVSGSNRMLRLSYRRELCMICHTS